MRKHDFFYTKKYFFDTSSFHFDYYHYHQLYDIQIQILKEDISTSLCLFRSRINGFRPKSISLEFTYATLAQAFGIIGSTSSVIEKEWIITRGWNTSHATRPTAKSTFELMFMGQIGLAHASIMANRVTTAFLFFPPPRFDRWKFRAARFLDPVKHA